MVTKYQVRQLSNFFKFLTLFSSSLDRGGSVPVPVPELHQHRASHLNRRGGASQRATHKLRTTHNASPTIALTHIKQSATITWKANYLAAADLNVSSSSSSSSSSFEFLAHHMQSFRAL
jgi:hypothetical protein